MNPNVIEWIFQTSQNVSNTGLPSMMAAPATMDEEEAMLGGGREVREMEASKVVILFVYLCIL